MCFSRILCITSQFHGGVAFVQRLCNRQSELLCVPSHMCITKCRPRNPSQALHFRWRPPAPVCRRSVQQPKIIFRCDLPRDSRLVYFSQPSFEFSFAPSPGVWSHLYTHYHLCSKAWLIISFHGCRHWRLFALYGMMPHASFSFCSLAVLGRQAEAGVLGWSMLNGGGENYEKGKTWIFRRWYWQVIF